MDQRQRRLGQEGELVYYYSQTLILLLIKQYVHFQNILILRASIAREKEYCTILGLCTVE
jgi:hypothetical protein